MKKLFFIFYLNIIFIFAPIQSLAESLNDIYEIIPDVSQCYEGILKQTEKDKALNELNRIRDLLNLPRVIYDSSSDNQTAQASLIVAANYNDVSHHPPSTHACFSEDGADGSSSNLYVSVTWRNEPSLQNDFPETEAFIIGYLIDPGVESVGHRRTILDPFLAKVSFGRVDEVSQDQLRIITGSALKVHHLEKQDLSQSTLSFVPYPCGNFPIELVDKDWYWSFSVLSRRESTYYNYKVDFSQTAIRIAPSTASSISGCANVEEVKNRRNWLRNEEPMLISNVSFNTTSIGLSNHLQWKVANIQIGKAYHVEIRDVLVEGQLKDYEYDVVISGSTSNPSNNSSIEGGGSGGCFISTFYKFKY